MSKTVTIGIPIYKRLEYLPNVLDVVAAQDYPNIDLLISDNGMNGAVVRDLVGKLYRKPYRFRQNLETVNMSTHFSQLIENGLGDYFVVLADDDEISSNYISDLVTLLERRPEASVALSVQESIDAVGNLISRSKDTVPEVLSGPDFIRAAWVTRKYGFGSFSTYMARREKLLAVGGYPDFWVAQGDEDALIVKMCLDNYITFSTRSTFRKRYEETTDQHSMPISDLAKGLRDFISFFDTDPTILKYAVANSSEWRELKRHLVDSAWRTYYLRWASVYRHRLPGNEWVRAAFALPFFPAYYRAVAGTLIDACAASILVKVERYCPQAYVAYRNAKSKVRRLT